MMLAAGFAEEEGALVLHDRLGVAGVRSVLAAMRSGVPLPRAVEPAAAPTPVTAAAPEQPPAANTAPPQPQLQQHQPMDVDDEDELQAALQMSMAPAAPPEPSAGGSAPAEPATLEARIRRHFAALVGQGLPPNEAAVHALAAAQAEHAAAPAPAGNGAAGGAGSGGAAAEDAGESAGSVEFVRFEAESVASAACQVEEINAWYAAYGDPFVDPSFPPAAKSLYLRASSAGQWKCADCERQNPLPPLPPAADLFGPHGETVRSRHRIVCAGCSAEASLEQCLARPSRWLSARADRIRDDVTLQFFESVPWTIFREQPRPDDIRQGALGDW